MMIPLSSLKFGTITATQVRRPWRTTARTVFQGLVGAATMATPVYEAATHHDAAAATGWAATGLAISAGVTRVMALPGVDAWLTRFLPFLAADKATPAPIGSATAITNPPTGDKIVPHADGKLEIQHADGGTTVLDPVTQTLTKTPPPATPPAA